MTARFIVGSSNTSAKHLKTLGHDETQRLTSEAAVMGVHELLQRSLGG